MIQLSQGGRVLKIRYVFLMGELIVLAFFVLPLLSNIINPGNVFGMIVSIVMISLTICWDRFKLFSMDLWRYTSGKIVIISVLSVIIAGTVYVLILTGLMIHAKEKSPEKTDAVIVLGCKVNGEDPSKMLKRRLDAAKIFLSENDDVICIVTGGKGDDEIISEAQAMKSYLVEKGIDADRIIMEDKSVNTYENLENSCKILEEMGIGKNISIVTDGFHQYRAGFIAKKLGYEPSAINAVTDFYNLTLTPTYYVREWMAITNEYIKEWK